MNENSETVELPLTDSICPPDLLSSDYETGQGCGTALRDQDTGRIYETMMGIPGPFLSTWTRAWITMSSGMGQENGQRERATSRDKSS